VKNVFSLSQGASGLSSLVGGYVRVQAEFPLQAQVVGPVGPSMPDSPKDKFVVRRPVKLEALTITATFQVSSLWIACIFLIPMIRMLTGLVAESCGQTIYPRRDGLCNRDRLRLDYIVSNESVPLFVLDSQTTQIYHQLRTSLE
jgi:hypothetical protein